MENTTTSGQAKHCRPKILWLADQPGWAYASIVKQIGEKLPDYEHQVFYMMDEHTQFEWVWLGWNMQKADIVVSMHWMYQIQLDNDKENSVVMLTGHRGLDGTDES